MPSFIFSGLLKNTAVIFEAAQDAVSLRVQSKTALLTSARALSS